MTNPTKIAILGRGKWGSAIKSLYTNSSAHEVVEPAQAQYLFIAKASQNILDIFDEEITAPNLVICSKGFFNEGLISDSIKRYYGGNILILSGANFADEVAQNLPAEATLAGTGEHIEKLSTSNFQLIASKCIISAQIGGACKNIVAIACGAAIGANLGENFRAKLFRQGLDNILKLNESFGGKNENINQPAIIGDLFLSCASEKSRNMKFGKLIAQGNSIDATIEQLGNVEGYKALKNVLKIASNKGLHLNLFESVDKFIETKNVNCLKEINS